MKRIALLIKTLFYVMFRFSFAQQIKYVKPKTENLRTKPNGDKLGVVLQNVPVKVIEEKGKWSKVQIEAWIFTPSLKDKVSSYSDSNIIVICKENIWKESITSIQIIR